MQYRQIKVNGWLKNCWLIQVTDVVRSLYGLRQAEVKVNQSKKEAYERKGSKAEVPGFDMEACLVELAQRQIDYEELEADLTTRVVATTVACQHNPQNLIKLSQEVDSSIIDLRYVKSVVWWKEALEYTLTFSLLAFFGMQDATKVSWEELDAKLSKVNMDLY